MMRLAEVARAALFLILAAILAGCSVVYPLDEQADRWQLLGPPDAPVRMAYRESGRGKPVLLIHGLGANTYSWRHLAPALARHHRVIAIDLKGFGRSDKPFDERYSVVDQAALVAEFMQKMGLRDVTVVGHSFGGGVALMLALDGRPNVRKRLKRLVLLDSIAYPQEIPSFFKILRTPVLGHLGATATPPELQAKAALMLAYHDDSRIRGRDVAAYARPLYTAGGKNALVRTAQQIVPKNLPSIARRYPTIRLPVFIVWCDHDKIVPISFGWRLHAALPNSEFHTITGCGHIPQEERPRETARVVQEYLFRSTGETAAPGGREGARSRVFTSSTKPVKAAVGLSFAK